MRLGVGRRVRESIDAARQDTPTWQWIALTLVAWVFVFGTSQVVVDRVANGHAPWYTDFAIFRQAGYLLGHGAADQVYRFVPSTAAARASLPPVWAEYAANHVTPAGEWSGYYYAQTPWHTVVMVPFGWLSLRTGYLVYSVAMIACMLVGAGVLARFTRHGWAWGSAFLLAPLALPILAGNPWQTPHFVVEWIAVSPLKYGSALGLTLWYGQYTPLLLALFVGALVAAHRGRFDHAGLLMVLATMKPTVLLLLPVFLLVTDEWIDLAGYAVMWATVFSLAFMMVPRLGYPWAFADLVLSYSGVFWPTTLQAHNWVLYFGVAIAVIALRWHGRPVGE